MIFAISFKAFRREKNFRFYRGKTQNFGKNLVMRDREALTSCIVQHQEVLNNKKYVISDLHQNRKGMKIVNHIQKFKRKKR